MTTRRFIARGATRFVTLACALAFSTSPSADEGNSGKSGTYNVTNLVSDVPGLTVNQDANLVNGWGIVSGPTTPMWVSDNGSGKSTVYDGTGALRLTVVVPDATGAGKGVPTGVVFNLGSSPTSNDFLVAGPGTAARFMWSTEDGAIAAWAGGPSATIRFVAPDGAVYKGLGRFSHHLLVGNFGDGTINAYDPDDYHFAGQLRGANHQPLVIEGLWGIAFGNGFQQQPATTLFFAAGPNDESQGIYGKIEAVPGGKDDDAQ